MCVSCNGESSGQQGVNMTLGSMMVMNVENKTPKVKRLYFTYWSIYYGFIQFRVNRSQNQETGMFTQTTYSTHAMYNWSRLILLPIFSRVDWRNYRVKRFAQGINIMAPGDVRTHNLAVILRTLLPLIDECTHVNCPGRCFRSNTLQHPSMRTKSSDEHIQLH
jgi:hypothetical protein